MENKYVIINKETIQKRIEELKTSQPDWFKKVLRIILNLII